MSIEKLEEYKAFPQNEAGTMFNGTDLRVQYLTEKVNQLISHSQRQDRAIESLAECIEMGWWIDAEKKIKEILKGRD